MSEVSVRDGTPRQSLCQQLERAEGLNPIEGTLPRGLHEEIELGHALGPVFTVSNSEDHLCLGPAEESQASTVDSAGDCLPQGSKLHANAVQAETAAPVDLRNG